jgi:hypothetical protein
LIIKTLSGRFDKNIENFYKKIAFKKNYNYQYPNILHKKSFISVALFEKPLYKIIENNNKYFYLRQQNFQTLKISSHFLKK